MAFHDARRSPARCLSKICLEKAFVVSRILAGDFKVVLEIAARRYETARLRQGRYLSVRRRFSVGSEWKYTLRATQPEPLGPAVGVALAPSHRSAKSIGHSRKQILTTKRTKSERKKIDHNGHKEHIGREARMIKFLRPLRTLRLNFSHYSDAHPYLNLPPLRGKRPEGAFAHLSYSM